MYNLPYPILSYPIQSHNTLTNLLPSPPPLPPYKIPLVFTSNHTFSATATSSATHNTLGPHRS